MKKSLAKVMVALLLAAFTIPLHGISANETNEAEDIQVQYKFDFGPGPVEAGYTAVACNLIYDRSLGYGFESVNGMNGRDRNQSASSLKRDFCFGDAYTFQVDLPNGIYRVDLIAGDEIASQAAMDVYAEGQLIVQGAQASAGKYIERSFDIEVADGQLNLHIEGNTARLNALRIHRIWKFDFGPGPEEAGYAAVGCDEEFSPAKGYGWSDTTGLLGMNQDTGDPLKTDFCYAEQLPFQIDLPNAQYKVTFISGDAVNESEVAAIAEGRVVLDSLPVAAGDYAERSFIIDVEDGQLNIAWTGSPAILNALVIEVNDEQQPERWPDIKGVLVEDHGSSVTLTNSELLFTINKGNARITALRKKGNYEQSNLLSGGGNGYYHLNYEVQGTKKSWGGSGLSNVLISHDDERAELSLFVNDPEVLPFSFDYRFVLEADSPGIYMYSIFKYDEPMPDGLAIEQSRYSFRANPDIFTHFGIEDDHKHDRLGRFPRPEEIRNGTTLMDATTRLPNGEVYTKYNHAVYIGDNRVNGIFGEDIGISIIRASDEFLVGGPAKQEYYVEQTTTTPLVHWYEQVRHYGVPNVNPDKGWEKIYGPFYVYVNEGEHLEALWSDVLQRTDEEQAKWPYSWMTEPIYATDSRGSVNGKLAITDGTSPNAAWIILGEPGLNVYEQNLDYLYYAKADAEGRFAINGVRPGNYTLYAYVDGVFGEYQWDGVEVLTKQTTDLGELQWTPEQHGELVWQIGTPDRTPREFKYGDQLRQWGLWLQYPLDYPDDIEFIIGESDERYDFNYAHPSIKTPGAREHLLVPRNTDPAVWRIRFEMQKQVQGTGTLTIAIAGSSRGSLAVDLNGTEIANYARVSPLDNDAAYYRSGESGYAHELIIPFDAGLLQEGENVMSLRHVNQTGDNATSSTVAIMYDAIRLEVDELSLASLLEQLERYATQSELKAPLLTMLKNRVASASHHADKGDLEQAAKHLEDFLKHLNMQSRQGEITEAARRDLEERVNQLIEALYGIE